MAGQHVATTIHLDQQDRFSVRREIGMVSHAALTWRDVNVAAVATALVGGDDRHVQAFFDFGEEKVAAAIDPGQR